MINKLDTFIRFENYSDALELLSERHHNSSNLEKKKVEEAASSLLNNEFISYKLSKQKFDTYKNLFAPTEDITKNMRLTGRIGEAEFPSISKDYSSIQAVVIAQSAKNIEIDKHLDYDDNEEISESEIKLFNLIGNIQNKIQASLKNTTILNWGITLKLRNRLYSGKLLNEKSEESKIEIKGGSFHFAAGAALVSYIFKKPINPDFIFTGTFNTKTGEAERINDIEEKIKLIKRERPNTVKFFIPSLKCFPQHESDIISQTPFIDPVENIDDLIKKVFGSSIEELVLELGEKEKSLGYARIFANHIGDREIDFFKDFSIMNSENKISLIHKKKRITILHFDRNDINDREAYQLFPLDSTKFLSNTPDFIIFNGIIPNHYFAYIATMSELRNFTGICGIRLGSDGPVFICLDQKGSSGLLGYKCVFPE
ncbi:MAG: hypothetical protein M0P71_08025 [Melioribacteraceae bacterium]|nr:hypothetical protein [Melioribacteraceae bacterium]